MTSNNASLEEQEKVMQQYVAENYAVVHVDSSDPSEAIEALIDKIEAETPVPSEWDNLRQSIEMVLYSTTSFAIKVTFEIVTKPDAEREVIARIPVEVATIASRMRNVEIHVDIDINQKDAARVTDAEELMHAMKSLDIQLPDVETFTTLLRVHCQGITNQQAKSSE